MNKNYKTSLRIAIILLMVLTACSKTVDSITVVTTTPASTTPKAYALATPYAQEPAAGICASPEGETVVVKISSDSPDPRCSKVKPDQKLTVINQTKNTIDVSLGRFTFSVQAGTQSSIDTPFGEYLAPGVHQLQVSPCCGAELWLESGQ